MIKKEYKIEYRFPTEPVVGMDLIVSKSTHFKNPNNDKIKYCAIRLVDDDINNIQVIIKSLEKVINKIEND